ncbi:MAG TPA: helix-turn-helix transcriptional regulator [Candidatus Dormibacteraeota bacterium]|nr:helix-turn-helix transcriptional regulator [Candidatus Dormibacteraeota bacterium]
MTDLRDQLDAFEAAARRLTIRPDIEPIRIGHSSDLGALLRHLRHQAGLSQQKLARRANVTKSGLAARERRNGMTVGAFIDHAQALGYDLALIPAQAPDRRAA